MKFSSEALRQEHPFAKLIPLSLFQAREYFNSSLSDDLILLMSAATDAALRGCLSNSTAPYYKIGERKSVWVAMSLSHPQLSLAQLDEIGRHLRLQKKELLEMAASIGRLDYIRRIEAENAVLLSENNTKIFQLAATHGHIDVLHYLATKAPDQLPEMIAADHFIAFSMAGEYGHTNVLRYLGENAPEELQANMNSYGFYAFKRAAQNGHIDVLRYFEEKTRNLIQIIIAAALRWLSRIKAPEMILALFRWAARKAPPGKLRAMITDGNATAFKLAAENGHISVLRYFEEKITSQQLRSIIERDTRFLHRSDMLCSFKETITQQQLQKIIAGDRVTFETLALNGHINVLRYFEEKTSPQHVRTKIIDNNFSSFKWAAISGHLHVLRYFEEKAPDQVQTMIADRDYCTFKWAAAFGQIHVLRYFEEKAPDQLQLMIAADNFGAFRWAAECGHVDVLRYLGAKAPDQLQTMIAADDFCAFKTAAAKGHVDVLRYLEEKAPNQLQTMIRADYFKVLFTAASNGHLNVLRYLEEKAAADQRLQRVHAAGDSFAFRAAASGGHLHVLRYLEEQAPEQLQRMIAADNFAAFRWAAESRHLHVLRYLEEQAPDQVQRMITDDNFAAFRKADEKGHIEVTDYLLSHASVFAYAEQHVREYGYCVKQCVEEQLRALREQKATLELEQPNAVFDVIDAEKARLLFYVIRHLIRLNTQETQDDLMFLLEIPAVKALVHTAVTPGQPNELVRLALSERNQFAANTLLDIPAVQALAEANDYYRVEQRGGFDLHQLAQNRESSMTSLSQGERARLEAAQARYTPQLQAVGTSYCMDDLRERLRARYLQHPATIRMPFERRLPFDWRAFQALRLPEPYYTQALKAYYQHNDHSAWRYLSKPNHWMHQQAGYVYINEQRTERWSTFEEYQPLIALLYLATQDSTIPATDDYTPERRFELFIKELALIGRAHNWDKTRIRTDNEGNEIREEYDDLEGDRPSCYSGVKRRLFQSVHGHPLFTFLTKEKVTQELNDFMQQHFQRAITPANRQAIKTAWDKVFEAEDLTSNDEAALKLLNITPVQQQGLINKLAEKYGQQFTADPSFSRLITNALKLNADSDAHILNFGHLHPEQFMIQPLLTAPRANGFFRGSIEDDSDDSADPMERPCCTLM